VLASPVMSRLASGAVLFFLVFAATGSALDVGGASRGAFPGRNGEIVFTAVPVRNGRPQVYVMHPDGTRRQPITKPPKGAVYPAAPRWSPKGERIVYVAEGSSGQLYLMRADGTGVRRVTHDGWDYNYPTWSPNGRRIAFVRGNASSYGIWAMNVNGTDLRRLTDVPSDASPAWSPDGSMIAFQRFVDGVGIAIWLMDADGGNQVQLTTPLTTSIREQNDLRPDWSPGGDSIAFERQFGRLDCDQRDCGARTSDIYVIRADGTSLRRLTKSGDSVEPRWSPDGNRIVFASTRARKREQRDFGDIYVMKADGTGQTRLTRALFSADQPDWQSRP
jgi:TolB protein